MAKTFKQFRAEVLSDSLVRQEYDALAPEFDVISTIIRERTKRGWTQSDLAKAVGTRQPVISRLECGEANPSLYTLSRVAKALNLSLHVTLR